MSLGRPSESLPRRGAARETLRRKGQFWTPDWVAEAMVGYLVAAGCNEVFDPAVGAGAFFRAAKAIAAETARGLRLSGREIDPEALQIARQSGLSANDLANVEIADFVLDPPKGPLEGIVANPPYIRHHRLSPLSKAKLRGFASALLGGPIDGRAGLHVYFLLRALQLLGKDGRLAFIVPADTCEGVFSRKLWGWITERFRLDAVATFAPDASPFPDVDTNPLILFIRKATPVSHFLWAKCIEAGAEELRAWTLSGLTAMCSPPLWICERKIAEGLDTGLSRPPLRQEPGRARLGDFARVMRGIATGANEFFFLTVGQAESLEIPAEFLVPAIGRTRDVVGDEIDSETLAALEARGRPTVLFSPDGRPVDRFPAAVRNYLRRGAAMGLHKKPLISTRCPWYQMEVRPVPPILFAYLGRRNARFVRNVVGVTPLTGFLCVYPRRQDASFVNRLWQALRHPATAANLALVGKSYGGGAIKVEPRALENLPLPEAVLAGAGLQPPATLKQLQFRDHDHMLVAERRARYKGKRLRRREGRQ